MKISRLDKVIENSVTYSAQRPTQDQIVFLLQDISETLAMIYDFMRVNTVENAEDGQYNEDAKLVGFNDIKINTDYHIQFIEFAEGYDARFVGCREDIKSFDQYAVFEAFGERIERIVNDYGKTWRCWTANPTKEQRETAKWNK